MKKILAYLSAATLLAACGTPNEADRFVSRKFSAPAQGTTYNITIVGDTINIQPGVDSILRVFDRDMSAWVENSLINQVNAFSRTDTVFAFHDSTGTFGLLYDLSQDIYSATEGAFDPTVYPLVEAWGFGLKNREDITEELIDSLLFMVGFEPFRIDMIEVYEGRAYVETQIRKGNPNTRLDFNAIAQGYSVDLIGDYLEGKGIINYMVELGGELKCRGYNAKGEPWSIGIDKPMEQAEGRELQAILEVQDKAVATSGSYRHFYEIDGVKYAHTIDPRTGYPVQHNLLSATVIANDCSIADAYATAFMVMGLEGTATFMAQHPDLGLETYLIYDDNGKYEVAISEGLRSMIKEAE